MINNGRPLNPPKGGLLEKGIYNKTNTLQVRNRGIIIGACIGREKVPVLKKKGN